MKKILCLALLLLAAAGCSIYQKGIPLGEHTNGTLSVEGVFDVVQYDIELGDKIQTTDVHPADSGFLSGETTAELSSPIDGGVRFGLHYLQEYKQMGWKLGLDLRANPWGAGTGYRAGMYEVEQQSSDTRPPGSGSFVYTQLRPRYITPIPFAGLQWRGSHFQMEIDVGSPYGDFTVESGHDRWGKWEPVQSESWSGWGQWYQGRIGYVTNSDRAYLLGVYFEKYGAEFLGEPGDISCWGFSFCYQGDLW
ncbi:hypothetical protein ACFL0Z_01425 [Patescibacteria group bacterium]